MKRILLDEGVPIGLVKLLHEHEVHHVRDVSWTGISDTEMIARAVENHFEVLVTTDQSIPFSKIFARDRLGSL